MFIVYIGRRRRISDICNVQLPVSDHQAVAQFAFSHSIHSWKQAVFGLGDVELVLGFLMAGKGVILAGKVRANFRQSVGEDSLIHPR